MHLVLLEPGSRLLFLQSTWVCLRITVLILRGIQTIDLSAMLSGNGRRVPSLFILRLQEVVFGGWLMEFLTQPTVAGSIKPESNSVTGIYPSGRQLMVLAITAILSITRRSQKTYFKWRCNILLLSHQIVLEPMLIMTQTPT
jgi:hypothetical protein